MAGYSYKVTDASGKIIKGTLKAEDEPSAVRILQSQGYIPIRLHAMEEDPDTAKINLTKLFGALFDRVSSKDVMVFTQDLAVLLEAGLPLDRALSILINVAERERFRRIIHDVLKSVEGGAYLSDSLAKHPEAFSDFYINMVKAGEIGGVLAEVLRRLGLSLESSQELKDFVVSAMIYPLFLVLVGGASLVVLLTFVIPKFAMIFSGAGTALPFSTKILLTLSNGLKNWWWMIPIGVAIISVLYIRYGRTPNGRYRLDQIKLRLPMMGELITKVETVRFARTLGVLLKSGVSVLQALELVRAIISNTVVSGALKNVHSRVKEGDRLSQSLADVDILPSLGLQMIIVGEESGRLEEMLLQVAGSYEKSVKETVKRLTALLEPVMILVMGLVVGFVVISMLMGIFSMNDIPF